MLTLIESTTIHTMIQCQVFDALGNLKDNLEEWSDKEGSQMSKTNQDFLKSKPRLFYGDRGVDSLIH